ncbi:penicillin acylase family protein [Streptomyces sp. NBC_01476]|uniref:penicillin acylase family protein n=1 Tax=Streptomyces sp. NBC_01476 TaxID=2903881 RepID=UPI002E3824A5|nr:penicillin acylase family protein [Streptomyces sp. NBC_01476]
MRSEVYRDDWGIPHLRAGSALALAHAQGRNAAHDRAWQIETERHRAAGTTAAFLGPQAVGWDVFARQAMIEDTARRCHARLDARTARWVGAYAAGVNAGLGEGVRRAPEFAATGLAPGRWRPWTPLAVWISTHILFSGFPAKFWRDMVGRRLGEAAVAYFATDGTGTAGSNGWLLTGERTASGAPLIAGDPHRLIEAPGVYQQIHLACPEYDVVGLAVPGVPGIAHFGHTGHVAWAITNAMADNQDLYAERLRDRAGSLQALGPDGWERVAAGTQTVEIAGAAPLRVPVLETARGPVIAGASPADAVPFPADGARFPAGGNGAPAGWDAVSLRWEVRVTGDLGFAALPALLAARTVADVGRALDAWAEPVNVVLAADTRGGVLHRVAGRVPLRDAGNGLRVVPAWEPRHAWGPTDAPLPEAPVHGGFAVMANERGLAAPLGVEFAAPHRARRIAGLLAASRGWTAKEMTAIHADTYLPGAEALLAELAALTPAALSPGAARLRGQLLGWERRMDADSTDAAAYAELRTAVVRGLAAHPAFAPLTGPPPYPGVFQPWLAPLPRIGFALESVLTRGPLPAADRAAIVRAALEEVAARPGRPAWKDLHRLAAWSALPGAVLPAPGLGGDHDCVLSTSSVPGVTHTSARGSAARFVWDLADRAESRWIVPFGADGVPGTPHRDDQLPHWLSGELVPVVTDFDLLTLTEEHPTP